MRSLLLIAFLLLTSAVAFTQSTITLRPDSSGIDATVSSQYPTMNIGSHQSLISVSNTSGGAPYVKRSMIMFDISSVPADSIIVSAKLSLYNDPNATSNGGMHWQLSGPNNGFISPLTSAWQENTITWNNKPTFSTTNEVTLGASISGNQDYEDIDITDMVKDWHLSPISNYGFVIRLATEVQYRSLIFASSDNIDVANHPKLVVEYASPMVSSVSNDLSNKVVMDIYPNPVLNSAKITLAGDENLEMLLITDIAGKMIEKIDNLSGSAYELDMANLSSGTYFIQAKLQSGYLTSIKFIKS